MKPLSLRAYDQTERSLQMDGGASGYAALAAPGLPNLAAAPPTEFGGPGDAWSPELLPTPPF